MQLGLTPWDLSDGRAQHLQAQAVIAERAGYASFWLPENHFQTGAIPDPLTQLASVAAATTTLRLGTTSYLLTLRHPLLAAEQVAVLDQLSHGRVILGVGRGFAPDLFKAFDIDPNTKREIFENILATMRRAWAGESIAIDEVTEVTVSPRPLQQPHPPVWVAAFGPKALEQAGRLGLPYLASPLETLETLAANYARHRAAGADGVDCVPVMRTIHVSDSAAEIAELKARLAQMPRPRTQTVPDVDAWAIVGEPGWVRDEVQRYRETLGITHLIAARLRIPGLDPTSLRRSVECLPELLA